MIDRRASDVHLVELGHPNGPRPNCMQAHWQNVAHRAAEEAGIGQDIDKSRDMAPS